MIKIEIKSILGRVLFTYEKENNTLKETILKAINSGANLRYANLNGANLRYADLRYANLRYADLRYADLNGANLNGANLNDAKNKETAYLPILCKWSHCIIGDKIKIGCKEKTIKEWDCFFASEKEYETKRSTEEFKQIEAVYNAYKAYLQTLNK